MNKKIEAAQSLPEREAHYMKHRVEPRLAYYHKRANLNRWRYRMGKVVIIIAGATVAVLGTHGFQAWTSEQILPVVGILGALISVLESLSMLFKSKEDWLRHRGMHEDLEREKHYYIAKSEDYAKEEALRAFEIFVERFEKIIDLGNSSWRSLHSSEIVKANDK